MKKAPKTIEYLNETSKNHFDSVLKYLDEIGDRKPGGEGHLHQAQPDPEGDPRLPGREGLLGG